MKHCKYCERDLEDSFFHKCKEFPTGLAYKCKSCQKKYAHEHYIRNREKVYKQTRAWRSENKEKTRKYSLNWRHRNIDKSNETTKRYYLSHKSKVLSNTWRRRAKKLNATPSWSNRFFIEEIYDLAKRRQKLLGVEWHVDHIVPLVSDIVCGLHTEANLRVILGKENQVKGNRSWPNMP